MAQTIITVSMDKSLKAEFETVCNFFGMDILTAINLFAMAVVREQKIPFEISASGLFDPANATKMFNAARKQALENGVANMTMKDIDEEIDKARRGVRD